MDHKHGSEFLLLIYHHLTFIPVAHPTQQRSNVIVKTREQYNIFDFV